MAVKKRKIIRRQKEVLNRASIENLLMKLEYQSFIFKKHECFVYCEQIVDFLASLQIQFDNNEDHLETIELAQSCLVYLMSLLPNADLEELILDILIKVYIIISENTEKNVNSSLTSIFVMFNVCTVDYLSASASKLLQKMDHGSKNCNLYKILTTFYYWLILTNTEEFGKWVLSFIHAMEEYHYIEVLVTASIEYVEPLFLALTDCPIVTDVIFHLLTYMRHMEIVFEKIAMVVPHVLIELAHVDRQRLQKAADILSSMIYYQMRNFNVSEQEAYKDKYEEVFKCLEEHMAFPKAPPCPNKSQIPMWIITEEDFRPTPPVIIDKVGLFNNGNTCFMNSVIQALFFTREFSNKVILKNSAESLDHWTKLAVTFAEMLFTKKKNILPDEMLKILKNSHFTPQHQHDSSEFLMYLFNSLEQSDVNADIFTTANMVAASTSKTLRSNAMISTNSTGEERPSTPHTNITAVSSSRESTPLKRQLESANAVAAKKPKLSEANLINPTSILDECFAGTQVTHVTCLTCHIGSCTEDKFRDLPLSFPEKTGDCSYNVQELLDYYCSGEILYGDNEYYCQECQARQIARRSVTVDIAPRHLILVLKNFEYDPKQGTQKKLFHSTYYNNKLILPTLGGRQINYNLYAAVVHEGDNINSGHYYTIAEENDQWYRLDDDYVTVVKEGELNKTTGMQTPYMLFYRQEDCNDVIQLPSIADIPPAIRAKL